MLFLLALALSPNPRQLAGHEDAHELAHSHGRALCGCEKDEPDHPFTIDCTNAQAIRDATLVLESDTCEIPGPNAFEWGGTFDTPDDSYKWVAQAVDGAYADPSMKLVIFSVDATDASDVMAKNTAAASICR